MSEPATRRRIGDILLELGFATAPELADASLEHDRTGEPLGQILVARGVITRLELASALAEQWSDPSASIPMNPKAKVAAAVAPPPHDEAEYAARLQDAVADLARRVQESKTPDETDTRLIETSQRIEATVARSQRIEATVATLAESLEGVTVGVEEAFQGLQAGAAELAEEVRRIESSVADLAARPVEVPRPDPAIVAQIEELHTAVADLVARPRTDDELRATVEQLASRLETLADGAALDDLRGALRELEGRAPGDPELECRLDRVEARVTATAAQEELESHGRVVAELREMVAALQERPAGEPSLDARLADLEVRLGSSAEARSVDELAARLDGIAERDTRVAARVEDLESRLAAEAAQVASLAASIPADDGLSDRVSLLAARLDDLTQSVAGLDADLEIEELTQGLAALRQDVAGVAAAPVVDSVLADRVAALDARVEEVAAAGHDQGSLATRLERVEDAIEAGLESSVDEDLAARVFSLSERLEQLSSGSVSQEAIAITLESLEERVEAVSVPATDEALTGRVAALAADVEGLAGSRSEQDAASPRLEAIEGRLQADLDAIEVIGRAVDRIREELDDRPAEAPADSRELIERIGGLEEKLAALAVESRPEPIDPAPFADALRGELDRSLAELRAEMAAAAPAEPPPSPELVERLAGLEARLTSLAALEGRLDEVAATVAANRDSTAEGARTALIPEDLENRLAELRAAVTVAAQPAVDTATLRMDLERRIADLAALVNAQKGGSEGDTAMLRLDLESRLTDLAASVEQRLAAQPAAGAAAPDAEMERVLMAIERVGLHLGEHDRALADLGRLRGIGQKLDELSSRIDGAASGGGRRTADVPGAQREIMSPDTVAPDDLVRRLQAAEASTGANHDRLMTHLERITQSIDKRLQQLEARDANG